MSAVTFMDASTVGVLVGSRNRAGRGSRQSGKRRTEVAAVRSRSGGGRVPFRVGFAASATSQGHRRIEPLPVVARLDDGFRRSSRASLADVPSIAILQDQAITGGHVFEGHLQHALHSRVAIEQAKGMLAARARIDMDEAFRRLRGFARANNHQLTAVCVSIVAGLRPQRDISESGWRLPPERRPPTADGPRRVGPSWRPPSVWLSTGSPGTPERRRTVKRAGWSCWSGGLPRASRLNRCVWNAKPAADRARRRFRGPR